MANEENYTFLYELETARAEIRDRFSQAHMLLQERENVLLSQLQEVENAYFQQQLSQNKNREELLATKENLQAFLKGNENREILYKMLTPLENKLKQMKEGGVIQLIWYKERELESLLKQLCAIQLKTSNTITNIVIPMIDYHAKYEPVLIACKFRIHSDKVKHFKSPTAVAIHPLTKNIYVIDALNNRVQVFDSNCKFLFTITKSMDYPAGICFQDNRMYVTQFTGNVITVYTEEGEFVQSIGSLGDGVLQFKSPLGICHSGYNNALYICERDNNRIQVFDHNLSFDSFIFGLHKPVDVKASGTELFVLDRQNPCFHVYNYEHQLIREVISLGDEGCQVCKPVHFCLDTLSNILLTDYTACRVIVFTKDGKQIYKFGKEGKRPGCFIEPRGIALDSEERIIVASQNPDHCIQFF